MFFSTNVVLIDDTEDELLELQKAFFSEAIPCLPIHYQYDMLDNKSGIDHLNIDGLSPRIIVTDLNLRESSNLEPLALFSPLADMLKKLVSGGPYLLILWSKNHELVNEVMRLLEERVTDLQLPIHYSVIDKKEYSGEGASSLQDKIKNIIVECDLFNAIINWESRILNASKGTSDSLFKLTKPTDVTGASYQESHIAEMQKVLAVIGNETLGTVNAKDEPGIAVDLGLAPVLQDQLSSMYGDDDDDWTRAVPEIGSYSVTIPSYIKSKLNSFFHLEEVEVGYPKNCKGVFVELDSDILSDEYKKKKLEMKLGRSIKNILMEEFISTIPIDGFSRKGCSTFREQARSESILGFVEVSADCDQAQKKVKLNRYLLAILIPIKYKNLTVFENKDGELRETNHEGIYKAPVIQVGEEEYILKLSFKYQLGTTPSALVHGEEYVNTWFGNTLFRLREQLLNDISFKCSQYSTRPGIVCFQ